MNTTNSLTNDSNDSRELEKVKPLVHLQMKSQWDPEPQALVDERDIDCMHLANDTQGKAVNATNSLSNDSNDSRELERAKPLVQLQIKRQWDPEPQALVDERDIDCMHLANDTQGKAVNTSGKNEVFVSAKMQTYGLLEMPTKLFKMTLSLKMDHEKK